VGPTPARTGRAHALHRSGPAARLASASDERPPGLAALIAELIERLELDDVTLVGNDTGGALCQLVVAAHADRVGRLVLVNCDAFEHFPPPALKLPIALLGRVPGSVAALAALGRLRPVRRATMSLASLTVDPIPDVWCGRGWRRCAAAQYGATWSRSCAGSRPSTR
jgi:pimeloyl-ACP methyl ester carboxylesterase